MYSNIPSFHVAHFIGRASLLESIDECFVEGLRTSSTTPRPTIAVLSGIGGQGKSQTALQYCHLSRGYTAKFWVNATSREATMRSFERIASELSWKPYDNEARLAARTGGRRVLTWEQVTEELGRWDRRWLLVFDNYDDQDGFSRSNTVTTGSADSFPQLPDFFPSSECHEPFVSLHVTDSPANPRQQVGKAR